MATENDVASGEGVLGLYDATDAYRRIGELLGVSKAMPKGLLRVGVFGRVQGEHQTGWVQLNGVSDTRRSANSLALGVDANVLRETQLFSEYRLRDAISGRDLQLASGARHFWDVAEGIRANVAVENVKVLTDILKIIDEGAAAGAMPNLLFFMPVEI